jgi:hypothetical protein
MALSIANAGHTAQHTTLQSLPGREPNASQQASSKSSRSGALECTGKSNPMVCVLTLASKHDIL